MTLDEHVLSIDTVTEGMVDEFDFVIDQAAMDAFAALSGDRSYMHVNPEFAKERGFSGVIVYGGLLLAKLSGLLGRRMPGLTGLSASWSVKYHKPLYVGECARLRGEVIQVSQAVSLLGIRFDITCGARKIASGQVQALLLPPPGASGSGAVG